MASAPRPIAALHDVPADPRGSAIPGSRPGLHSPLQTAVWKKVSRLRGKPAFTGQGPGWHALAILEQRAVGSYLYVPYGPVARTEHGFLDGLEWARTVASESGALFLRVEPQVLRSWSAPTPQAEVSRQRAMLSRAGFRPALADLQPRRTRCIDLARPAEEVLGDMTGTNRTVYRSTAQRGISVGISRDPADIGYLAELMSTTAARSGFTAQEPGQLTALAEAVLPEGHGALFLARHDGRVISAILTLDGGGIRVFAHGATDRRFSRLRAHQSAVITAILDARRYGVQVADLYGIAPTDDPQHPWAGFSRFKASFGGYVVEHAGAWDLPVSPAAYKLVRSISALRRGVRTVRRSGLRVATPITARSEPGSRPRAGSAARWSPGTAS
ncbi:lipid II:glycine glycyltransferase FemX [Kocuria coralli]|nr:peptidoglycan bridge formation glycyltransferase FemA/FemB family protein [Kocuria coralli]